MPNGAKTSPETIEVREKRKKLALELRKAGMSFDEIAKHCGYAGRQGAYEAVKTAIAEITRPAAEEVLTMDLERLDTMFSAHYARACAGDPVALNNCLRVLERRARMLGIDAPVKQEIKSEVAGGVLVVPGMMDEGTWTAAAAASQTALAAKEDQFVQAPAKARRRVED